MPTPSSRSRIVEMGGEARRCQRGHLLTPENTQSVGKAGTRCRECRRKITREWARRKKGCLPRNPSAELVALASRYASVLRRLKKNGDWSDGPAPWTISNALVSARRKGLCESKVAREYPIQLRWRITPLGLSAVMLGFELDAAKARGN